MVDLEYKQSIMGYHGDVKVPSSPSNHQSNHQSNPIQSIASTDLSSSLL